MGILFTLWRPEESTVIAPTPSSPMAELDVGFMRNTTGRLDKKSPRSKEENRELVTNPPVA